MTTNFAIKLPAMLTAVVKANTVEIGEKRTAGEYSSYPVFVHQLMKGMATPAEELHHACTGMAGEAGEILDLSKKVWVYEKPLDCEKLIEELGDLRFYYQAALNMLGLSDDDIKAANTVKLRKRFPNGVYSNAAAINRADKKPGADRKFFGKPDTQTSADSSTNASSNKSVETSKDDAPGLPKRITDNEAARFTNALHSIETGERHELDVERQFEMSVIEMRMALKSYCDFKQIAYPSFLKVN